MITEKASDTIKRKPKIAYPTSDTAINAFVEGTHFDEKITRSSEGRLHARFAGYCPRHESLAANLAYTERRTPQSSLYSRIGVAAEKALVEGWQNAGVLMGNNIKLKEHPTLNLGGEIDAVLLLQGELCLMEVKTCGNLPEYPNMQHERQALVYSLFTGLPAHILYVSRNVMEYKQRANNVLLMREFVLPFNTDVMMQVAYTVAQSHCYSDVLKVAPMPAGFVRSQHCRFCPFQPICYDGEDTALNVPTPDVVERVNASALEMAQELVSEMLQNQQNLMAILQEKGSVAFLEMLQENKIKLPEAKVKDINNRAIIKKWKPVV